MPHWSSAAERARSAQRLRQLLAETSMHARAREVFDAAVARTLQCADALASSNAESPARQMASALYHVTTAVAMAWEAGRTASARRMRLAQLVLRQRLLPQDPLALHDEPVWLAALLEPRPAALLEAVDHIDLF